MKADLRRHGVGRERERGRDTEIIRERWREGRGGIPGNTDHLS